MINIVLAANDNYAPLLGTCLNSFLINNKKDFKKFNIFILDDKISKSNQNKINEIAKNYNTNIKFIPTKNLEEIDVEISSMERNFNLKSYTAYARLFISNLIPETIDKVLYLDCDSIIVDSFREFWDLNIDNYYCAGVLDETNAAVKKQLKFKKDENYINTGVLLINLKKWREDNVEEKFIRFMIDNEHRYYQHDQGIINNVFKGKILIGKPKYNLQVFFQTLEYDLARKIICIRGDYYSREIMEESQKNPVFLHFCGGEHNRPWFNKNHPYRDLFEKYTTIYHDELINDDVNLSFIGKSYYTVINNSFFKLILKLIPKKVTCKIINKYGLSNLDKENQKK